MKLPAFLLSMILLMSFVSPLTIDSVSVDSFSPGSQGQIRISVENNLNEDVEDASINLVLTNLPFIPIGSSQQSFSEIEEGDEEEFIFTLKSSNQITPGDYEVPYTLSYEIDNRTREKSGTIGIRVEANPQLSYSVETENPIIDERGTINFRIVNKGLYDARFVSIEVVPTGFDVLSQNEVYIGNVDSDDFETASFDVLFKSQSPVFSAKIEYTDFNNNVQVENVNLPFTVYTRDRAIEIGLIEESNTFLWIGIALLVIILWFVWRSYKKRQKNKRLSQSK